MTTEKTYRGLKAIAGRLGVSLPTAHKLVKGGAITHRRLGPTGWIIEADESAIREYLRARTVERVAA